MSMKDKAKSGIVTAFGIRRRELFGDTPAKTHRYTRALLRDAFRPAPRVRVETFEEAVERRQLSDDDLKELRWQQLFASRLGYALMFGSLGYALYSSVGGDLLTVLGALLCATNGAVLGFIRAFRVHQLDCRELMSFPAFWRQPEGWFK